MPNRCIVRGCESRDTDVGIGFFRIPSTKDTSGQVNALKVRKLEAWFKSLNIDKNSVFSTKSPRVCGRHFIKGKPSKDMNDPDWVPSLNLQQIQTDEAQPTKKSKNEVSDESNNYSVVFLRTDVGDPLQVDAETREMHGDSGSSIEIKSEEDVEEPSAYFLEVDEIGAADNIPNIQDIGSLVTEVHQLRSEVKKLNLTVEKLKQELLQSKQNEVKLQQMVEAVREIVNENIQTRLIDIKEEEL